MAALSLEARQEIEDLLTEFSWLVDHGRAGDVADLFTRDAQVATPRFELNGRDEIREHFSNRGNDGPIVSRHKWSNLRIHSYEKDEVMAETIVQTYLHKGEAPAPGDEFMIGDSIDTLKKGDDGKWRFSRRELVIAFINKPQN